MTTFLILTLAATTIYLAATRRTIRRERDAARVESAQRLLRNEVQAEAFTIREKTLEVLVADLRNRLHQVELRELPQLSEIRERKAAR